MIKTRKMISMFVVSIMLFLSLIIMPASTTVFAATHDASFIRTELPDEMLAGHVYRSLFTAQNLGTNTWTRATSYSLAASTSNQFIWSQFREGGSSTSTINQRVYLPSYANVLSYEGVPFYYSVTAPTTAGNYTFGAQMVQDGVQFFGQTYSKTISVKNIVVDGLPKKLKASSTYNVTISVINKGTNTWTSSGNYVLARLDSNFVWSNWCNGGTSTSANLNSADSIAPNEGTSFSFTITTPSTAGTYSFSAQVRVGSTGYSDTYTSSIVVDSDSRVYSYEGETFFENKTGTKSTDSASGGSYGYSQGAGNTAMYKNESNYTPYVNIAGEYNVWLKVNSTQTNPLRIQMYGGPTDGIYADYTTTDINAWRWIGPLKVNFQSGYTNYKLALWKLGGSSTDFVGIDQVYIVSTDVTNAFAKKLSIDESTMNYIVPQTTSTGINVNANTDIPVFYSMVGTGSSIIQLTNQGTNDNYLTLNDSMVPDVIRIKVEYLGKPSTTFAQFRFTNTTDSIDGKACNTILKADGYGKIFFDQANWFNPQFLDSDLLPGQSATMTFRTDAITVNGNYVIKVGRNTTTNATLGTFTVAPANIGASTIITSGTGKTRLEAENKINSKTGTVSDNMASNGSSAYASNATGNISMNTGSQSYSYFVNSSGVYYVYARVRGGNHAAPVRMQIYGTDGSSPGFDEHLGGSSSDWTWIGPIKTTISSGTNYNLAFWRLGGETNDKLEVDEIQFIKEDYYSMSTRDGRYPTVGANDAYNHIYGLTNGWKMLDVHQPPKATNLYVKLANARQMSANKETLNVTLGSNMTTTKGDTINDWTINEKRVLMAWYYPYRQADVYPDWQSQVTTDLQAIVATGYNVILLQLFPQFVYSGSAIDFTLTECRRLGIKVLPSVWYVNQSPWLINKVGINFRYLTALSGETFADASDPQFAVALSAYYDLLYTNYGDVFYTNASGDTPIMYLEEHGYGFPQGYPLCNRKGPDNIENMRLFRDWLKAKYVTNTALNTAWGYGSNYPAFGTDDTFPNIIKTEIYNSVLIETPRYYTTKWREGGVALMDYDTWRSYSLKVRWLDIRSRILSNHPDTLFGGYTFARYGLEDNNGSYYDYNAYRPGVLADDLATYTDFESAFYTTPKEIESATNFWHSKGKDLIPFIHEYGEVNELGGSTAQTAVDQTYTDIPGLNGIIYQNSYPIYASLKESVKVGAVPGVYAWNDYPLSCANNAAVREDVSLFKSYILDAP